MSTESANPTAPSRPRVPPPDYTDTLHLDDGKLRELAATLRAADESPAAGARRYRRHDITALHWLLADFAGEDAAASGRFVVYPVDLSLTGVKVLHAKPAAAGTRVSLRFPTTGASLLDSDGAVVNFTPVREGVYALGIQFDQAHQERIVQHLTQSRGSPAESHPARPAEPGAGTAPPASPAGPSSEKEIAELMQALNETTERVARLQARLNELMRPH